MMAASKKASHRVASVVLSGCLALAAVGCAEPDGPPPNYEFAASERVRALPAELQEKIAQVLEEHVGTPRRPKLLGEPNVAQAHLEQGRSLYLRYCYQCHGVTGDGNGPAARYLIPRPRDYRPGTFKFTSTTYGSKPLREDLIRTVRRGIRGTSMPAFNLLSEKELSAVVDYVLVLTYRGELEAALADAAEIDGAIDPATVPELIATIKDRWKAARGEVVYPRTPMPTISMATVEAGKQAFLTKGCAQCHGPDGTGQTKENIGVDSWGNPTKAADLTSGMLRGGTEPIDVYRHIDAGINGTPMPSFRSALEAEPETIWNLVSYVFYLSDRRREGVVPPAGLMRPLPGVEVSEGSAGTPTAGSAIPSVLR